MSIAAGAQQSGFPTLEDIMNLARSIANDMYSGVNGANGRVLTDDAPFTLPYINSALRTVNRKLRNEGVKFPIKDNVILSNLTPVVNADPTVQVYLSFTGYFDGTNLHPTPSLPNDLLQPLELSEQTAGTNLPFTPMAQPQGGLISTFQGPWLSVWEWRQNYRIYMVGSTQTKNLRLRYQSGQLPFNVPASAFSTTYVNILDCDEAMAYWIAKLYAEARGADPAPAIAGFEDAISEMANEWARQQQTQNFRRPAYEASGSNDIGTPLGPIGTTQGV